MLPVTGWPSCGQRMSLWVRRSSCHTVTYRLNALYDDHVLDEPSRGHYRMYDLIRDFARNLAGQDPKPERDDAVAGLVGYYQRNAAIANHYIAAQSPRAGEQQHPVAQAGAGFATRRQAMAWMHIERGNLLACADYALTHDKHAQAIRMASAMATFLRAAGPWDQAIVLHRSAAAAARRDGDQLGCADALNDMGDVLRLKADYQGAAEAHADALEIYRALGSRLGQAETLNNIGALHLHAGSPTYARTTYQAALELAREIDAPLEEGHALEGVANCASAAGYSSAGLADLRRALAIYRRIGAADAVRAGDHLVALGPTAP